MMITELTSLSIEENW